MQSRTQLRQTIRQRRQKLSATAQQQAAESLKKRLICHPRVITAKRIALYLSTDGELNTLPFIEWCWQHNKQIYLPVIHPFSKGQLLFLCYEKHTTMVRNQYKILEPKLNMTKLCLPTKLDLLFTPLVAFDNTGARLGMGGGFYDRTLAHWYKNHSQPNTNKTNNTSTFYPIGLAHNCQQVSSIPTEYWDIPLPEIITPSKHFTF